MTVTFILSEILFSTLGYNLVFGKKYFTSLRDGVSDVLISMFYCFEKFHVRGFISRTRNNNVTEGWHIRFRTEPVPTRLYVR